MDLQLRYYNDPILRQECTEVDEIDEDLIKLVYGYLHKLQGFALAAPQVGITERFFVLSPAISGNEINATVINPMVIEKSSGMVEREEGCFSLFGISARLERPDSIRIKYYDIDCREEEVELHGLVARVVQHELDHLDGILFIDHLSRLKRKMVLGKFRKTKKQLDRMATVQ